MFVQIIEGKLADPDRFLEQFRRWEEELQASAPRFLDLPQPILT